MCENTTDCYTVVNTTVAPNKTLADDDGDGLPVKSYVMVGFFAANLLFVCGGNALVILTFAKTRALQTINTATIINLAITDFCVGLYFSLLIVLELRPHLLESEGFCRARIGLAVCLFLTSVATLTVISVERCIGILRPLQQRHLVTPRRIKLAILATWCFSLANGLPLYSGILNWSPDVECWVIFVLPEYYLHFVMAESFTLLSFMTIIYSVTFCAIHRHKRKITAHLAQPSSTATVTTENVNLLKAFAILVGILLATELPFCFLAEISLVLDRDYVHGSQFITIYKVVTYFIYLNSAVNSVVYSLRIPAFRRGLKELFRCGEVPARVGNVGVNEP